VEGEAFRLLHRDIGAQCKIPQWKLVKLHRLKGEGMGLPLWVRKEWVVGGEEELRHVEA